MPHLRVTRVSENASSANEPTAGQLNIVLPLGHNTITGKETETMTEWYTEIECNVLQYTLG